MGNRIILWMIMLGSIVYGVMAMASALAAWRRLPDTLQALEQERSTSAQQQAQYLRSVWHRGELALTALAGALFLAGALGWRARRTWRRMTLYVGAWVALLQMAWTMIVSLEWFRGTGTGMFYQINVINVA